MFKLHIWHLAEGGGRNRKFDKRIWIPDVSENFWGVYRNANKENDDEARLQQYVDFVDIMVTNGSEFGFYSTVKQDAEKTVVAKVLEERV